MINFMKIVTCLIGNGMILYLLMRLSAAEEVNLTGVVGGSITLPDPLLERGFLLYEAKNIASVRNRELEIFEETYLNKLLWDTETGFFTITDLQRNDSGVYRLDPKKGRSLKSSYQLTVYDSVPPPAVKALSVSSDGCSLLCSVDREATLLWFKGEQILNQSSSASSLPLTVNTEDLRSSYRCVAANPAENKTLTVNINETCSEEATTRILSDKDQRHYYVIIGPLISIVFVVLIILTVWMIKRRCFPDQKRTISQTQDSVRSESEVQYTQIQVCSDRKTQEGNGQDSCGSVVDESNLTTVYDQLQAHRITQTDAAVSV